MADRIGPHGMRRAAGSRLALAMVAGAALLCPHAVEARDLSGTISLGRGLDLVVEIPEGFFAEILRTIHMRSTPRPTADLTELGKSGDRVFVGTDFNLYCERQADGAGAAEHAYKVGNATKLWDIHTAPGVKLEQVQAALGNFTGDAHMQLKVEGSLAETKAPDVERAGFKFWLDEVVFQYDNPGRRKGKVDNCTVISAAILDALPSAQDDPQERFDNFNVLIQYVRDAKDVDLIPLRDLLKRKISGIKDQPAGHEPPAALLKGYEDLQAEIVRRTEGL